jgi:hypothetical protein
VGMVDSYRCFLYNIDQEGSGKLIEFVGSNMIHD